jgi:hypothetical protein
MQLNIDFDKIKLVYLQQEIIKKEAEIQQLKRSRKAYKGWVKRKSKKLIQDNYGNKNTLLMG